MSNTANTFSCDIHIADPSGTALLSGTVRTRNVMTGCAGATAEESAAKGVDIAADPRGYGDNALVYVVVHELCGCCGGSGRVAKMRGKRRVPFGWLECKACKGAGFWYAGKTLSVLNH
jgi:hypothetical protein